MSGSMPRSPEPDAPPRAELMPGSLVRVDLDPVQGREQSGRRPALVVASPGYLRTVDALVLIVPLTTVDRGWPNHVAIAGADRPSWAMTEQLRAVSRSRVHDGMGIAGAEELAEVRRWLGDFLDLPPGAR